jgi:ParB-like chromosome segregation protein Spo0J
MDRKLKIEYGPPGLLRPNGYNVNVVSPDNEAKIDESVKRFGLFKPVLVRELKDGTLEIVGGEHRWRSAQRLKMESVPYMNLGKISDREAAEIGLVDNGRYGAEDSMRLAGLLEAIGAEIPDLSSFMPYSEADFNAIFATSRVALDELDFDTDTPDPIELPTSRAVQTHQILRFKMTLEDAEALTAKIKKIMKTHGFKDSDELTNAGDALLHMIGRMEKGEWA